ncbi:MAG: gamma-glutamylcyclotransferase family protein [Ardenticatenaceae bacterium]|nr:gamma-glutamylcyclotransferase family protein [Ardenticatenaceae bacterium]
MSQVQVDVFFYGSYINFDVLAEVHIDERPYQVAWLPNHKLVISPLANLVKDLSAVAFGIVTKLNHDELTRLYVDHAQDTLGGVYLPEAVVVYTDTQTMRPALTYISHDMAPAKPDPAYVDRIYRPAKAYSFPSSYLAHIASFR